MQEKPLLIVTLPNGCLFYSAEETEGLKSQVEKSQVCVKI